MGSSSSAVKIASAARYLPAEGVAKSRRARTGVSRARARWDIRGGQLGNPCHMCRLAFLESFRDRVHAAARALSDGRGLVVLRLRFGIRVARLAFLRGDSVSSGTAPSSASSRVSPLMSGWFFAELLSMVTSGASARANRPLMRTRLSARTLREAYRNLLLEVPLLAFLVVTHQHLLARLRAGRHAPRGGADLVVGVQQR